MQPYVTTDLLRDYLGDQVVQAGIRITGDLVWSDPDLIKCLEAAARSYNSIPPNIGRITDATRLDAGVDFFLNAAAAAALERKVLALSAERTAFEAGGIQTDPDGAVIDGMTKLAAALRAKFNQEARAHKADINMRACFGRVGG